jgi:hypothetical protein
VLSSDPASNAKSVQRPVRPTPGRLNLFAKIVTNVQNMVANGAESPVQVRLVDAIRPLLPAILKCFERGIRNQLSLSVRILVIPSSKLVYYVANTWPDRRQPIIDAKCDLSPSISFYSHFLGNCTNPALNWNPPAW